MTIHKNIFRLWLLLMIPAIIFGLYHYHKQNKALGEELYSRIATNIGANFVAEKLVDTAGNIVKPDYASETTIIDVWFKECPPCIHELKQFYNLLKGKDKQITVISLSVDRPEKWKELFKSSNERFDFLKTGLPNWKQYNLQPIDPHEEAMAYVVNNFGFNRFPGYFVLDRSGKIIATPPSAVEYIRNKIYNESEFGIYLKQTTFTNDGLLHMLIAMIMYTGIFWLLIFVILSIRRLFR